MCVPYLALSCLAPTNTTDRRLTRSSFPNHPTRYHTPNTVSSIAAEGLRDSGGRLSDGRDPFAAAAAAAAYHHHPSSFAHPHSGLRAHDAAAMDPRHRLSSHPGGAAVAHERPSLERLSDVAERLSGPGAHPLHAPPPHSHPLHHHSPNSPPQAALGGAGGASPSFFPISEQDEDGVRLSNLSTFSTGGHDIVPPAYAGGGSGGPGVEGEQRDSLK